MAKPKIVCIIGSAVLSPAILAALFVLGLILVLLLVTGIELIFPGWSLPGPRWRLPRWLSISNSIIALLGCAYWAYLIYRWLFHKCYRRKS